MHSTLSTLFIAYLKQLGTYTLQYTYFILTLSGQYGFLNYETEEGKKLFFHQSEVKDGNSLSPGDEVEFVIITNQKTGKSSACSISRIM